jgi:hypothetical protein
MAKTTGKPCGMALASSFLINQESKPMPTDIQTKANDAATRREPIAYAEAFALIGLSARIASPAACAFLPQSVLTSIFKKS